MDVNDFIDFYKVPPLTLVNLMQIAAHWGLKVKTLYNTWKKRLPPPALKRPLRWHVKDILALEQRGPGR